MGILSSDGQCKTFSAKANGYGRGEGCGAVVLKRLEDARADGDSVLAVIKVPSILATCLPSWMSLPHV